MRVFILLLCFITTTFLYAGNFKLNGSIKNYSSSFPASISYLFNKDGIWIKKNIPLKVENGRFSCTDTISGLTAVSFYTEEHDWWSFYLEPGTTELYIDLKRPYKMGLPHNSLYKETSLLQETLLPVDSLVFTQWENTLSAMKSYKNLEEGHNVAREQLKLQIQKGLSLRHKLLLQKDSLLLDFISSHLSFRIAPYLLSSLIENGNIDIDTIQAIYKKMSSLTKDVHSALLLKDWLSYARQMAMENSMAGGQAFNFSEIAMNGEHIELKELLKKEKYVLLDFWASWCMPCEKEIPKLKQLYAKYKDKGLECVSISLDTAPLAWKNAIREHELKWPQLLNKKNEKERDFFAIKALSIPYHVQSIPTYFLIDRTGKIVGRWNDIDECLHFLENSLLVKK